jgi:deoxyadenosine/deoxycytidine kinase
VEFKIKMSKIICIQGNIGSGKSTLLRQLEAKGYICLQEPVDTWSKYQHNGKSILEYFYEDKAKYAFPFQMMAFYTRMKAIKNLKQKMNESLQK